VREEEYGGAKLGERSEGRDRGQNLRRIVLVFYAPEMRESIEEDHTVVPSKDELPEVRDKRRPHPSRGPSEEGTAEDLNVIPETDLISTERPVLFRFLTDHQNAPGGYRLSDERRDRIRGIESAQ
jgi:hypothetical protein